MATTRQIRLAPAAACQPVLDDPTRAVVRPAPPWTSLRDLFVTSYPDLRAASRRHQRPGAVLIAATPGHGVTGELWLAADDRIRAGVIGRHSKVDLRLAGDDELSLRHLVLLVETAEVGLRLQLIDLRSGAGMIDEQGQLLQSVVADGPVFVRTSRHALFCFPTPLGDWPAAADDGWNALPERVACALEVRPWPAADLPALSDQVRDVSALDDQRSAEISRVTALPGVLALHEPLVGADESPCGELVFDGDDRSETLAVGASALDRGVLLGRYRRCDTGTLETFRHRAISRVHGLVLRRGQQIVWIDTASTNPIRHDDEPVRVQVLDDRGGCELPNGVAVSWRWTM